MYVGKTRQPLKDRVNKHVYGDTKATRKWLEDVVRRHAEVSISVLDVCDANKADAYEMLWIARYAYKNPNLLNIERPSNYQMLIAAMIRHQDHSSEPFPLNDLDIARLLTMDLPWLQPPSP